MFVEAKKGGSSREINVKGFEMKIRSSQMIQVPSASSLLAAVPSLK